ncbi:hypothetical protein [Cryobacterium sp. Y62]|uniref:hypothetical protein n=1 Tax=Cryobacterium sp. Y62 TaxID=2048284 RepID=UPI0018ED6FB2|nr:hypothetical protein [Cryobacterium sp. Y62]
MTRPELRDWAASDRRFHARKWSAVVGRGEAVIVHRRGNEVRLTLRSLTRAALQQPWRTLYPLLSVA